ncbi:hypothetical protein MSG28_015315 [Choristoneura fumiferana]|uniref:Uncharacterized protein n=1 Tax=Choristoneura fumiferana TaxID=7141 RepID=A0ACC0KA90_CHOFU|nr:hypothetical protein MSG28_015315 [Choristoneura fumiferana]
MSKGPSGYAGEHYPKDKVFRKRDPAEMQDKTAAPSGDAGPDDKKKKDAGGQKGKGKKGEDVAEEELPKTDSQILAEEAEYRAMLRRTRFKRQWPEVTKVKIRTRPWHPPPPPQRIPQPMTVKAKDAWKCSRCLGTALTNYMVPLNPEIVTEIQNPKFNTQAQKKCTPNKSIDNVTVRTKRADQLSTSSLQTPYSSLDGSLDSSLDNSVQSMPNVIESSQASDLKDTVEVLKTQLNSAHEEILNLNAEITRLSRNQADLERQIITLKSLLVEETPNRRSTPKHSKKASKKSNTATSTPVHEKQPPETMMKTLVNFGTKPPTLTQEEQPLFNPEPEQGVFPEGLKVSIVKPLYKKGKTDDLDSYRQITLVSVLSKIFEKAMHARITAFCNKHNIIKDEQNGFQQGKSTSLAVFITWRGIAVVSAPLKGARSQMVELPELTTRRWVPPYRRRRRPRPRRMRVPPEEVTREMYECNRLRRIWHNFMKVDKNKMMLQGSIACNSKRYSSTHCGSQTGCIAVACRVLLQEKASSELTRRDVDELIETGDRFYHQCMVALKCYKGMGRRQ